MIQGLGTRLCECRRNYKLSQKEVATAIGVSPAVISNYENDERVPSLEALVKLARLFRCSTDYLLGFNTANVDTSIDVSMLTPEQHILLQSFIDSLK